MLASPGCALSVPPSDNDSPAVLHQDLVQCLRGREVCYHYCLIQDWPDLLGKLPPLSLLGELRQGSFLFHSCLRESNLMSRTDPVLLIRITAFHAELISDSCPRSVGLFTVWWSEDNWGPFNSRFEPIICSSIPMWKILFTHGDICLQLFRCSRYIHQTLWTGPIFGWI